MTSLLGVIGIQNGYVLVAITLLVLPIAATAFAQAGPAWQSIGKGPFAIEQELPPPRLTQPPAPVDKTLQEAEARQMLEAKSYRQSRRGEAPIDVEAEVRRALDAGATRPNLTEELRTEVNHLVKARNERRMRRGEQPLDVGVETERQIVEFIGLGE